MEYIRKAYGVKAYRLGRVRVMGSMLGTITGATNSGHLRIRIDGEKSSRKYHPTWEIEYL
jgi:hypothetical protein